MAAGFPPSSFGAAIAAQCGMGQTLHGRLLPAASDFSAGPRASTTGECRAGNCKTFAPVFWISAVVLRATLCQH